MYTLEEYEQAKAELARWSDAWDRYSGNNPHKYEGDLRAARRRVQIIEGDLKNRGLLTLTEKEVLERELDAAFPDAKHKELVVHKGKSYQRLYVPAEKSRSGKSVTLWGKSWEAVTIEERPNT